MILRACCLSLGLLTATTGMARAAEKQPEIESSAGQNVFSLLPKSLQKNPLVDQTVITEMTPAGKALTPPSSSQPAYYAIQSGGYHQVGHGSTGNEPLSDTLFKPALERALSAHGYQPASTAHPASLLLIYHWGSSSPLESGDENTPGFSDIGSANLLTRARLIGGEKFAQEFATALRQQDDQNQYKEGMQRLERSFAQTGANVKLGVDLPAAVEPLQRFMDRDNRTRQLVEQSLGNSYYAIVSAYDYAAAAEGRRQLLWRTKMTVESDGVSMADTLPTLIVNAGKYFGRDMPVAATLSKRISEGHVKLHELEFKEYLPKSEEKKPDEPGPKQGR